MSLEKILVVEDNIDNLELLQLQLKFLGWESVPARSGVEALEQLENLAPAAILVDMVMSRMDGFALARSLKKNPKYRDVPILAVTALAMPGDRERCLRAGCDGYISKPFTHRDLQKFLRHVLLSNARPKQQAAEDRGPRGQEGL